MKTNKIACCYLTHNHPDVVKDVLTNAVTEYANHGIDMIFCDSSDDYSTKEIVEQFIKEGNSNIYYADARNAINADDKYLKIIKGEYLTKSYDYIWPCKDRVYFSGEVLNRLDLSIEQNNDLIMMVRTIDRYLLGWNENEWIGIKENYNDATEFFAHFGKLSTNWEAMIFNTSTLLNISDWNHFISQYNLGKDMPFNQTVTIFSRLAEMTSCKVNVLHTTDECLHYSKFATSEWLSKVFSIWIDKWIPAIFNLPQIYDAHKFNVFKSSVDSPVVLFGSVDFLCLLHNQNLLTSETFQQYRDMWASLSSIPVDYVDLIINDNLEQLYPIIMDDYSVAIKNHDLIRAMKMHLSNKWLKNYLGNDYDILEKVYINILSLLTCRQSIEAYKQADNYKELIEIYNTNSN